MATASQLCRETHLLSTAVLPNWSLNRTLCGGLGLGFKSLAQTQPTAKCRLARTLGRTFSKPCSSVGREYRKTKRVRLPQHCRPPTGPAPKACRAERSKLALQAAARTLRNKEAVRRTMFTHQAITGSASVALEQKSFQFVFGASRRRAAPRSQSFGAAQVAQCLFIGYRGPL